MLKEARPYQAIVIKGDERKRKSGGSPRHHIGDAFTSDEFVPNREAFKALRQRRPDISLIESPDTFSWMGVTGIHAIIFHEASSNRTAGEIHGCLSHMGLRNDTGQQVVLTADQMQLLKAIAKRNYR